MGSLFSSPKSVKAPPPPVPVAPPPTSQEDGEVGDIARKKRPRGRRETFLTGELIPEIEKKRRLA